MATDISRLLVLGPDQGNNVAVISKLQEISNILSTDSVWLDVKLLNIQTKYYRALVQLHVHQVRDNTPEPVLQHKLHDYEAVMCVVDASKHDKFLHMRSFVKRIVNIRPYDVCLLVTSTSSATTKDVKTMEEWCKDSGFEFIDLDGISDLNETSVIDEKQGIERVLEALHCHMWRSMKRNPPRMETTPIKVEKSLEVAWDTNVNENKAGEQDNERGSAVDDAKLQDEEQGNTVDETKFQVLLQDSELAGNATVNGISGDDVDWDQFSALIAEVGNVRHQGEFLTDEKRRERAAEVAMKLWNFLGADDEDGDSEYKN